MSDLIRLARQRYGSEYDRMAADAGRVKAEYVRLGGNPDEVYSPERVAALQRDGAHALEQAPPTRRQDGTIAAPYLPLEMAVEQQLIEPAAMPSVLRALLDGVSTVSSGTDQTGRGYAIGRDQSGRVVRVSQ